MAVTGSVLSLRTCYYGGERGKNSQFQANKSITVMKIIFGEV